MIIVAVLFLFVISLLLFIPPIPQWNSYHNFSDSRSFLGINNFANVTSNIGFVFVGFVGLIRLFQPGIFHNYADRIPYVVFFLGIILVGIGSAYYHWNPSTETLFWDRLPMVVSFMSFFAAIIADRIHNKFGIYIMLPILITAGILSLIYWRQTEMAGAGDLRLYELVQYFPLLAVPLIILMFRDFQYTATLPVFWVMGWYICAKFFEHFDADIFIILTKSVSGHTLKHLSAAVAAYYVSQMLIRSNEPK